MKVVAPLFITAMTMAVAQDLDQKAQEIIDAMSLDQLLGQMTQINMASIRDLQNGNTPVLVEENIQAFANEHVGSYFNTPFPWFLDDQHFAWDVTEWRKATKTIQDIHVKTTGQPMIYALDSIHGASYVKGAVLFPHQFNVAATFDPKFARTMGEYTGRDTKAAGANWIFGPCLDVARHKNWPRIHETFGEDPVMVSVFGKNMVEGMQSQNVAATFKHFIGYSSSVDGQDRQPVTLSTHEILNIYVPSFKAAIDAGILAGMDTFPAVNGIPMAANPRLAQDLLRHDLGFDGVLSSDFEEIYVMDYFHHYASDRKDAVDKAMNDGSIDMSMVPADTSFIAYMKELIDEGKVSMDRVRTSAKRMVKMKLKLDLYNKPNQGGDVAALVGDKPSRAASQNIAKESLVLLKNKNNILPLNASKSFFFTGSSIDNIGLLCGGWSLTWQGQLNPVFPNPGRTIYTAMKAAAKGKVDYYQGVDIDGNIDDINVAKTKAARADYTVVAIGEKPYAEFEGNIDNAALPQGLIDFVNALATTGTKIILVLVEGRPRQLKGIAAKVDAVVFAGLPCEMGGEAIADALFGKENFSGKLAITYPKGDSSDNLATAYYNRRGDKCIIDGQEKSCPVEWAFGQGLSYTTFAYTNLRLSSNALSAANDKVTVTVNVKNTGKKAGKEAVLLFVTSPTQTETKLLKKFSKIELSPGQATDVSFVLTSDDIGRYVNEIGEGLRKEASSGKYFVAIKYDTDCTTNPNNALCGSFTWTGNEPSEIKVRFPAHNVALATGNDDYVSATPVSNGNAAQLWTFSNGMLANKANGRCLDAWEARNDAMVHSWDCSNDNVNQKWKFDSNTKQLRHATHTGFCLDFDPSAPSAPAHMWECLPAGHPDIANQQVSLS